jgi:hypothetical protein
MQILKKAGVFCIFVVLFVVFSCSEKKESSPVLPETENQEAAAPVPQQQTQDDMGMWVIGAFVDEFGDKTDQKYITCRQNIRGTFSNVATTDDQLDVTLLFTEKDGFLIQLYEYGRDLGAPATAIGMEKVTIAVQDGSGEKHSFTGQMAQTYVFFAPSDRDQIRELLTLGGTVKFRITIDTAGVKSNYSFDLAKADYFDNAYRLPLLSSYRLSPKIT